jgi:hypothetical protein
VSVSTATIGLTCDRCDRRETGLAENAKVLVGSRCPRIGCDGHLAAAEQRDRPALRRSLRSDRNHRVVAREHVPAQRRRDSARRGRTAARRIFPSRQLSPLRVRSGPVLLREQSPGAALTPHQPIALNEDNSAQDSAVIDPRLAARLRKERLQPHRLRLVQGPLLPSRGRVMWTWKSGGDSRHPRITR